MERHAFAQRDGIDRAVFGNLGHVRRQQRHDGPVGVERIERFKHVLGDDADQIGGRCHGVEGWRLANGGHVDRATFGLRERKTWQ